MSDEFPLTKAPSKTHSYAAALYDVMDKAAEMRQTDGGEVRLWTGFIRQTCDELGIPQGVYRRVLSLLEDCGCLQILQRGVRGYPSLIALLKVPTAEVLESGGRGDLTRRLNPAMLESSVRNMQEQIGGLNVADALVNIEQRLKAIEAWIARQETNGKT